MRRGSLAERMVKCSRPGCPCQHDDAARHGPYFSLTRTVRGKTQTRLIPPALAEAVRRQIEDGREFYDVVDLFWEDCEHRADEELDLILRGTGTPAEKGGSRRRSRRKLRTK